MNEPREKIIKKCKTTTNGWLRCPKCRRIIARAYFNAAANGIEVKCRCGTYVEIEIAK